MNFKRGDLAMSKDGRIFIVERQTAATLIGSRWYGYGGNAIPGADAIEEALRRDARSRMPVNDAIPYTPEAQARHARHLNNLAENSKQRYEMQRAYDGWFREQQKEG